MSNPAPTTRDNLRSNLLSRKHTFKRVKVIDKETGAEYEVRQPSIKERSDLRKSVTTTQLGKDAKIDFDFFRFMIMAAIKFTVVPGTDQRVFEDEDFELLAAAPAGGFTDELCEAASNLCNVAEEDDKDKAKKPSEQTPSDC